MASFSLLLFFLLPLTATSCDPTQLDLLSSAFRYVTGFDTSLLRNCSELILASRNLSGTVSWQHLRNVTGLAVVDLSRNSLHGRVPALFFESPSLVEVNLSSNRLGGTIHVNATSTLLKLDVSGNRFTAASVALHGFPNLRLLDLSFNNLTQLPPGLGSLSNLNHLDLSSNGMSGSFPSDFPPMNKLQFLNLSFNRFHGEIAPDYYKKYGNSAFAHSGILPQPSAKIRTLAAANTTMKTATHKTPAKKKKQRRKSTVRRYGLAIGIPALASVLLALSILFCLRWRPGKKSKPVELGEEEPAWVTDARVRGATARVVMYEKPLMELTFSDLAAATSGFSRDAELAEGAVYRAVLSGDMHVVVKRVPARDVDELVLLRHPNILPLLGHCLAAGSSLLVYPYMDHGDLSRWLREPPLITSLHVDGWAPHEDWPTRFRIALGVARGLAYLHHAGRVHARLDSRSVLLTEDLEPRVYYTASGQPGASAADDVYGYGVVLLELLSGSAGTVDMIRRIRSLVREERGSTALDDRIGGGSDGEEREMVEALRVAYLCTAEDSEKRPGMKQVVGMLKDVRPAAAAVI